jgi:hypothetical protein
MIFIYFKKNGIILFPIEKGVKMNEKEKMIALLDDVVKEHEKHRWALGFVMKGIATNEEKELWLPEQSCLCGQFISLRKMWIIAFFGSDIYTRLYALHKAWHSNIYKIKSLREKSKKGFLGRFLKSGQLRDGELDIAKAHENEALKASDDFLALLKKMRLKAESIAAYRYEEFASKNSSS